MLDHPAIQAYLSEAHAGKLPGQDADADEDIGKASQLGTDIALMGEENGQPKNER